ncbi:MAG: PAS domain S-box protein, partial [Anaerolineales bacterium]|nr:PAS domain S-box protein [Anaerolineales bacterium]
MAPKKAASGVQIDMEGQGFELLFKNHPIPMWIYDLETLAFLDVNDAAVKKYGYTRREFLKLTIKDIRPAEDIPQLLENLEGKRPALQYSGCWRHQLKNGEIIFVEITSHLFNLKGRKAVFVLVHDVTERKQAEEALHESESRYRDLVENSQDLICTHDLEGNLLSVNEAAVKLTGYSRKFLLKMNLKNALAQGGQRDVEAYLKRIQEKGRARGEMQIRTAKGEVRIWEYDNTLRKDDMEKPIVRGMARDITERKRAEQAMHESEMLFRQVWESTSDAMVISDAQGIVLAANPAYYKLYGYSPQQLIGESFAIIFPKDAQDAAIEQYKEIFSTAQEGLEFESAAQRADGMIRNVESRISFLTSDGKRTTMLSTIRDITERKEAEELQKKTEIYYHSLFEQTHDAVFIIDLEGRHLKTNQRAADLLGYKIEEIIGLTISDTSAEQEQSRGVIQRLLNGEHIPPYERLFRKKDGSSIPVEVNVELIRDSERNPLYVQSVARDITERKQTEEKLIGSEERYRSISEDMPAMVCRFKPDGTLTFINSFYCDYFKTPHDQLLGSNLFALMPETEAEFVRSKYLSLDKKKPYITYEHKMFDAAGNETWQRWTDRALFNEQGEVIEYQSIGQDVTEIKKAEQQLAESEARLSALIANSGDLIVIIDTEGKITFASPSAERIFGYTPEEAIGKNFVEWIHPDDLPQAFESFQNRRHIPGIAPENIKVRGHHKDGSWRHVEALGTNLLDDPSVKGIVLNIRDETDQRRAQVEKDVLYEIMQGMAFSQSLSEFLNLVHYSIERVFPAKNIFVSLYDPSTELFEDAYCVDEYDEPLHPSKREGTLTSYLFRTGIPLLANDEKFKEMMDAGEVKLVGTESKSWMGVPLKTAGKTIGVMAIQDYEKPDLYTEKDLAFLASISGQVASAVERKQAEEKLQESEKRFFSAFENAPIGMALVSIDGQWLKVNQAMCEFIGYSESELTSLSFQKITHPDDLESDLEYLQETLAGTRQTYQMEKRYQHKLGHYVWAALNVSLVKNEKGTPLYFISQIKDITERKQAEDILIQSEKRYRSLFEGS